MECQPYTRQHWAKNIFNGIKLIEYQTEKYEVRGQKAIYVCLIRSNFRGVFFIGWSLFLFRYQNDLAF